MSRLKIFRHVSFSVLWLIVMIVSLLMLSAGPAAFGQQFVNNATEGYASFHFKLNDQGWIAGFANYRSDESPDSYSIQFQEDSLESPGQNGGFYLAGKNHRRDGFEGVFPLLYLKRKLTGLNPNSYYSITFDNVKIASSAFIKDGAASVNSQAYFGRIEVGANTVEPMTTEKFEPAYGASYQELNVHEHFTDVSSSLEDSSLYGSYGLEATSVATLGTTATIEANFVFQGVPFGISLRDGSKRPICVKTDNEGSCWLFVGSGLNYQQATALFYQRINISWRQIIKPRINVTLRQETSSSIHEVRASYTLLNASDKVRSLAFEDTLTVDARIRNSAGDVVASNLQMVVQPAFQRFLLHPSDRYAVELHIADDQLVPGETYTLEAEPTGYPQFLKSIPLQRATQE